VYIENIRVYGIRVYIETFVKYLVYLDLPSPSTVSIY
jgi:hypothetical protein